MKADEINDLIARLETAIGPDRDLDRAIWFIATTLAALGLFTAVARGDLIWLAVFAVLLALLVSSYEELS